MKEGVENYKKLITGMLDNNRCNNKEFSEIKDENTWKKNFELNPDMIVYGTGEVKILDYGILW